MDQDLVVRLQLPQRPEHPEPSAPLDLPATLLDTGDDAERHFRQARSAPGTHLLLKGDRDYHVVLRPPVGKEVLALLMAERGQAVLAIFPGRAPVSRVLLDLGGMDTSAAPAPAVPGALDLTAGIYGAPPLFLLPEGSFSSTPGPAPAGMALLPTLVTAARWISSRRTSTFERLFPPSSFRPDEPVRGERLTAEQAGRLLAQVRDALSAAATGGPEAQKDPEHAAQAAQLRSAALTVLSHLLATVRADPGFRQVADAASAEIFALIDKETGPTARPALRAHAIELLQMRGPALNPADRERATGLVRGLVQAAPPYDELRGPWRFALCSGADFHPGECEILKSKYNFREVETPADVPPPPKTMYASPYRAFEAPFQGPQGQPIQILARVAGPRDENREMAQAYFIGLAINRHAQLGAFDMAAASVQIVQAGYKVMLNAQCSGLTTRFAIAKMFPDADIYSSWDSTYYNTNQQGQVIASEGVDCFVALITGMSQRETHEQLDQRLELSQWPHPQTRLAGVGQFIGPSHPLVVDRFVDLNLDGKADYYDGFLDFSMHAIKEDLTASMEPRDPGVPASQVGGDAAEGLDWAAGSLDRAAEYSELWRGMAGESEILYSFQAAGFYSHHEPPLDVPAGPPATTGAAQDPARLPAVCRYLKDDRPQGGLRVEVMFHSYLSHAAQELKRLLCAAEAMWRALDLGYLQRQGPLGTRLRQRGAVLLLMAGLLEFPADQNFIDGLWDMALKMLNLPPLSRSVVRGCITEIDHQASLYYGSVRGLYQLVGKDDEGGDLKKADPAAYEKMKSDDPLVGRARELTLPA